MKPLEELSNHEAFVSTNKALSSAWGEISKWVALHRQATAQSSVFLLYAQARILSVHMHVIGRTLSWYLIGDAIQTSMKKPAARHISLIEYEELLQYVMVIDILTFFFSSVL